MAATVYEFGDFKLDSGRFQLSRAGRTLKLERKPLELLILLAARNGDLVTRAEIAERLWGSEVFVDTEHGINTAIRKIRQVLRDDSEEPRFIQTVTAKGYRFISPIVAVEAAPADVHPALNDIRAAAESPLPSSAAQPSPPVESKGVAPSPRLWLWISASMVLVVFVVAITLRALGWRNSAAKLKITSLAVLPLDNLSGDHGQDYFADGMTDELTTMLAKDSTLRVISRTSAMQFKDLHQPLREVAGKLGVDGIVEGSISRADGKVHMTVQLIHAPTDTHLWADSYDRENNDVAALPEEAALAIAKRLNASEAALKPARYVNPEAHDAYLHGRYLWLGKQYDKSAAYFRKATDLQPDYALGWSGLADYYGASAMDGALDPRTALPAMDAAARKAIGLDDTIPQTHLSLAATYWLIRWDLPGADREAQRTIQIDPAFAEAYHVRAWILGEMNRHSEAIEVEKKAMEVDPFARTWTMANAYLVAHRYDAAITEASQRLDSTPNDAGLHAILSTAYHWKGNDKQSVEMLAQVFSLIGMQGYAASLRHTFEHGGYNAVVRFQIHDMEHQPASQYLSVVDLAGLYARLRQREKTLSLLEEGYRRHSPSLLNIQNDPAFDFLHKDQRYRSLINRIGLPPAW